MEIHFDSEIIHPKTDNFPYLVFIHGAGGDRTQWNYQRDFFVHKKYGVITISLPGHGDSPPAKEVSISAYTENVRELLLHYKITHFILLGHSMGGGVVLQYVINNPKNLPSLIVLIDTGAKLNVAPVFFDYLRSDFEKAIKLMADFGYSDKTDKSIKVQNYEILTKNGSKILLEDLEACQQFDIREDLSRINVPTLIVCGDEDQMTPLKFSQYLRNNILNSQLFIIPDAGHFSFQEMPNQVNDIIFHTLISGMNTNDF